MRLLTTRARGGSPSWRARTIAVAAAIVLTFGPTGTISPATAQDFDVSVDSVEGLSGLTAVVAHSDDGVNLRADPSQDADILDTLPDGTEVDLRIDRADTVFDDDIRWWPVSYGGVDGWIAGFYLDDADGTSSRSSDTSPRSGVFSAGDYVAALTDDGTGLNIRSGAGTDFERVGSVADGDVIQVMEGPDADEDGNDWYVITDGDVTGYVIAEFIVAASQPAAPADEPAQQEVVFDVGDYVASADGDEINIRYRGFIGSDVIGSIPSSGSVRIVGRPTFDDEGAAWYKVENGDIRGFALGDLLVVSDAPVAVQTTGPTGTFIYPLENYVFTQSYGCSVFTLSPYDANLGCHFHNGIDVAASSYTPVLASDGGTVIAAGWCDCGLGYYVEIDHGNGFSTVYGHMAEQPWVFVGQVVDQGDQIGPVGSTGYSTGPHVHFMLKLNGATVNPLDYI